MIKLTWLKKVLSYCRARVLLLSPLGCHTQDRGRSYIMSNIDQIKRILASSWVFSLSPICLRPTKHICLDLDLL